MLIEINEDVVVENLEKSQARDLIVLIDAYQQCCHFTVSVINALIDNLECDMTREDIAEELGFKVNIPEKEL